MAKVEIQFLPPHWLWVNSRTAKDRIVPIDKSDYGRFIFGNINAFKLDKREIASFDDQSTLVNPIKEDTCLTFFVFDFHNSRLISLFNEESFVFA